MGLNIINHPLLVSRLDEMRDVSCKSHVFRQNLKEIGTFLTYEAARDLDLTPHKVTTPLENMDGQALSEVKPALISILRAGNGLLDGALLAIPEARVGFLGMFRDEESLRPVSYYENLPEDLSSAPVFVFDPMLATGHSALAALQRLRDRGAKEMRLITLLCAPEGVAVIEAYDKNLPIYTVSLDRELNERGYICPGLGDAGDRLYNSF